MIDETALINAKYAYYKLANALGENGRKQAALVKALRELENDYYREEMLLRMNSLFQDGLAYGNWPWIKNGVDTLSDTKD